MYVEGWQPIGGVGGQLSWGVTSAAFISFLSFTSLAILSWGFAIEISSKVKTTSLTKCKKDLEQNIIVLNCTKGLSTEEYGLNRLILYIEVLTGPKQERRTWILLQLRGKKKTRKLNWYAN